MAHYRASDSRREQFRKYLEKGGVVDGLTNVLVTMYEQPEKPADPLEFLKTHLGVALGDEELQQEVHDLRQRCECLEAENKRLKTRLQEYEAPQKDGTPTE
ncbi:C-Myc-binding protein [Synchiropus splendidus]|uniref:C-Myc-binding protein n=1 Tax=Synchiropus splendidus TaxID=270530 RepID=UPI00237DABA6|nr:C-Myc-binding protein [Synchiropus splendidus]